MCVLTLISGCASATGAGNACDGWRAIRPEALDVSAVSPELARQIVAHNRFGESRCGWRPT
jgi:hypothetical protein